MGPAARRVPPPGPAKPAAPSQLTPVTVQLGWIPDPFEAPYFLALHRGYYKQHGLDVKLILGNGSALAAQQIANGTYSFGIGALDAMALVRGKGGKIKMFYLEFPRSSFGVATPKSAGVKDWKDLYGKKILVSPGSPETYLLPATFHKLGLDMSKVDLVNVAAPNKVTDYLASKADAVGTNLGGVIPLIDSKRPSDYLFFGDVLDIPNNGAFTRDDYLSAHPDAVKGFVLATEEATKALVDDPKAIGEAASDSQSDFPQGHMALDLYIKGWGVYAKFIASPLTQGHPYGWIPEQAVQSTLSILHDFANFQGSMNPGDFYTNGAFPAGA